MEFKIFLCKVEEFLKENLGKLPDLEPYKLTLREWNEGGLQPFEAAEMLSIKFNT